MAERIGGDGRGRKQSGRIDTELETPFGPFRQRVSSTCSYTAETRREDDPPLGGASPRPSPSAGP